MDVPHRRPTLDEVARRAGVSRTVASRAVNGGPDVSRAKREAVARAVEELGFVPNATARALATHRAGAVVLAVAGDDPALFADPFHARLVIGVASVLEEADLDLTLLLAASARGQARLERALRAGRADGFMVVAARADDPLTRFAAATDRPVVFGGHPPHGEPAAYVDVDNAAGARLATEHLLALGRRRVVHLGGPAGLDASAARERGVAEALAAAGAAPAPVERADFDEADASRAMARLLVAHPDLDGVVAASDNIAAGALRALRAYGRSVPGDVAVVGFDDLPVAQQTEPALTTVHQPIEDLGRELAAMLVRLLGGGPASPVILPTRLVVRGSAPAVGG
ncbi:LacI family DNA-binding transcriptional regulator [Cellulomonas sp. NS3]|uniref:LacI family DNA-binding transcriptional regulator n=1 Tax=Cellulomonas sp. NS3 TaxID=2973977 RepID=UPI002162E21D|nr:LacI family DNA-binding transcriptional regulator [Cellulomonas sp. NS3]